MRPVNRNIPVDRETLQITVQNECAANLYLTFGRSTFSTESAMVLLEFPFSLVATHTYSPALESRTLTKIKTLPST